MRSAAAMTKARATTRKARPRRRTKKPRRTGKRSAALPTVEGDRKKIDENRTDDVRDVRGRFARGGRGGPGRRRGSPNRVSRSVKDAVVIALNSDRGGAVGFFKRLKNSRTAEDRRTFANACARLIPRAVELEADMTVKTEGPELIVVLPSNNRGPLPGETVEQFRERFERHREVELEVEARRRREHGDDG
jgi:hypothetical protein